MRSLKFTLLAAMLASMFAVAGVATAHDHFHGGGFHHFHGGFHHLRRAFIAGTPFWWDDPLYYAPYYPAVVAMPPVHYIERSDADSWCPDSKAYHPTVNTCASAWQKVAPTP